MTSDKSFNFWVSVSSTVRNQYIKKSEKKWVYGIYSCPDLCSDHSFYPTSSPPKSIPSKLSSRDFPGGPVVKNPPSNAGDTGSIPDRETKVPHTSWCN